MRSSKKDLYKAYTKVFSLIDKIPLTTKDRCKVIQAVNNLWYAGGGKCSLDKTR